MLEEVKRLLELAGQQRRKLIASCILAVIGTALGLVPFILIYLMVLELFNPVIDQVYVWKLVFWCIVAIILRFAFMGLSGSLSHLAAYSILYDLRIKLGQKLGTLPLGYFKEKNTGDTKTAMNEHVEQIELFIAHNLPDLTAAIVVPIFTAVFLFIVDWRMALATLAVIPVALIAQGLMFKDYKPLMKGYYDALEKVNSTVIEYTQGMAVIKAFNQTVESFRRYRDSIEEYDDYIWMWTKRFIPSWSVFSVVVVANLIVILPVGAWLYISGSLPMPTLILFLILGIGFSQPLMKLTMFSSQFTQNMEGVGRINEILTETPLSEPEVEQIPSNFNIEFQGVHFSYGRREVLNDIEFSVPEKTVTALVGPSGAGKTTIARLIPRFWDVNAGEISIGDVNIRDLATERLMSLVASVFQEVTLFNDTIYENIRMGKEDATEGDVIAAAKMAHCHEFIEKQPASYQTIIGEGGAKLSGGEKQRISIARAILKDAPIIILDEATAFVDPENEELIQDAITRLAEGKTLIIIAHRLSTITSSNQIIVMDEGKIVEKGTHEELLLAENLYSRMWKAHVSAQDWKFETEEDRK
uniref:Vitamin B12 import ATP-binding protein BtuD n=1 Tax=Candidatus Methanophaga sp. ANME-1 ERB7 TaxID=2759913 RepID=A0A7G9ZB01_9EURY|nr:vitamin B12 import ATP-binding protein BtuD [Methanosarcinales archaeon ANME-1 ERB7]